MLTWEKIDIKTKNEIETMFSKCSVGSVHYIEKDEKDPLEREYEARVDFWNRYIEATLAKVEFCCDRKYYNKLRNNLIEEAKRDLEPISKILVKRKQFENVTCIITIDKNKKE